MKFELRFQRFVPGIRKHWEATNLAIPYPMSNFSNWMSLLQYYTTSTKETKGILKYTRIVTNVQYQNSYFITSYLPRLTQIMCVSKDRMLDIVPI